MADFIIARASNGRPTLQHARSNYDPKLTRCGLDFSSWSVAYFSGSIAQLLCRKCGKL